MPCAPDPDMMECFFEVERMEAWALELENGWAERRKAWVKEVNPYPFIKAVNIKHLPTRLKTCLFLKGRVDGVVGLPTPLLMRIPR